MIANMNIQFKKKKALLSREVYFKNQFSLKNLEMNNWSKQIRYHPKIHSCPQTTKVHMFIRCIVVFSLGIKSFSGFFLHPTQIPVCKDRTEWLKRTECQRHDQMSLQSTRRQKIGALAFLNICFLKSNNGLKFVLYLVPGHRCALWKKNK